VLEERPDVIHCHDLNTAMIGLAAAARLGCRCVCDFHEWFSENVSWDASQQRYLPHKPLHKFVYWAGEFVVLKRATEVVTVCQSIADDLATPRYLSRRRVHVIRNIPDKGDFGRHAHRSVKDEIGVPAGQFVVLWQGGVGPTRLLEPIIEAIGQVPGAVLAIRGPVIEKFSADYLALAARSGAGGRVLCLPPVPSEAVVAAAASADLGVWSLPRLSKNFYYSLPNKIFEYLAAGLPIVGADFPEARRIIEGYGVGLCFDPYDPRSIATAIRRFVEDPAFAAECRRNTARANDELDARREWRKLVDLYDGMLGRTRTAGQGACAA
jgi:glycosyltransferase involved in cell wall biosynthesis